MALNKIEIVKYEIREGKTVSIERDEIKNIHLVQQYTANLDIQLINH